jgi:hypothetical protein
MRAKSRIGAPTAVTVPGRGLRQNRGVWRHPFLKILIAAYIGWGGWNWYLGRPVRCPDGILAPAEPAQSELQSGVPTQIGRWTLTPRATYRITARILGITRYHVDFLAPLAPEDLALGWGPMSDNRILNDMDISQSNRFYFWHSAPGTPVSKDVIIAHSANTHVIPENPLVARELFHLRPGQIVTLSGVLVNGKRDDGAWINSSLVRTDTGAGACEVMLVQDVFVSPPAPAPGPG